MVKLLISVVLFCSVNFIWGATPFKDCGSEIGAIQAFQVTDCNAAPCKLVKGNTYSMNLTFTTKAASNSAKVYIYGVIGGVPILFPLPDPDVCKMGVTCPINANANYVATMSLPVLQSYPQISLYVKLELKSDDSKQDYVCLLFPAVITSGAVEKENLVDWKKGKLFEMLN